MHAAFPLAWSCAAPPGSFPPTTRSAGYLWAWAENQVMAAVKAVPLGQTAGQRMLLALGERIPANWPPQRLPAPLDAIAQFPAGVRHRQQPPRNPIHETVPLMTHDPMNPSPLRVGIGGPVGSGKTALTLRSVPMRCATRYNLAVVTNDIYTAEDAEFLLRNEALPADRIIGVETGGCPHTAIRDDASMNLAAVDRARTTRFPDLDVIFVESGGDNLAATFSPELSDLTIYVIDVAAGDKIPRKGGPGITKSDLLVINKIDLAPMVGASLEVMDRDARRMRGERPFVFTNLKTGQGLADIIAFIEREGMRRGGLMRGEQGICRNLLHRASVCAASALYPPAKRGRPM